MTDSPARSTEAQEAPPADEAMSGARARSLVVGLVGLAVGVAVVVHGRSIGMGEWRSPGPGTWPVVVGVLLCVVSVAVMLRPIEVLPEQRFNPQSVRVLPGMISLYVFVWAFSVAGLVVPGFLLLVLWLRGLGRVGWLTTLVVSAVTTLVLQYLFVSMLGVPFPDDLILGGR